MQYDVISNFAITDSFFQGDKDRKDTPTRDDAVKVKHELRTHDSKFSTAKIITQTQREIPDNLLKCLKS